MGGGGGGGEGGEGERGGCGLVRRLGGGGEEGWMRVERMGEGEEG